MFVLDSIKKFFQVHILGKLKRRPKLSQVLLPVTILVAVSLLYGSSTLIPQTLVAEGPVVTEVNVRWDNHGDTLHIISDENGRVNVEIIDVYLAGRCTSVVFADDFLVDYLKQEGFEMAARTENERGNEGVLWCLKPESLYDDGPKLAELTDQYDNLIRQIEAKAIERSLGISEEMKQAFDDRPFGDIRDLAKELFAPNEFRSEFVKLYTQQRQATSCVDGVALELAARDFQNVKVTEWNSIVELHEVCSARLNADINDSMFEIVRTFVLVHNAKEILAE